VTIDELMSCKDLCIGDGAGIYMRSSGVRSVLMHTRTPKPRHNNACWFRDIVLVLGTLI
jgi:hypothetical protein